MIAPAAVACFVHCPYCGAVIDQMEVPVPGRWDYAEKFGYLAAKAHETRCPGQVAPSTLGETE